MVQKISLLLLIIGGLNWGIIGIFNFNCVGWLLGGSASIFARIVFTIVGLAALVAIPALFAPTDDGPEAPGTME